MLANGDLIGVDPLHCLHDCLRDNKYIPKSGLAAASGFDCSQAIAVAQVAIAAQACNAYTSVLRWRNSLDLAKPGRKPSNRTANMKANRTGNHSINAEKR